MNNMVRAFILFSVGFLSSCVSIGTGSIDADPIALVDMEETYRKAAEAGAKERAARLAKLDAFVSEPSDPVSVSARALFDEVLAARNVVLAPRPRDDDLPSVSEEFSEFFLRDLKKSFNAVRTHQEKTPPTVIVIGTDALVSTTYPDNTIVISRRLVESQDPWLARAVAAHELAHHSDGHAIFNWLATAGRRKAVSRQIAGAATKVTKFLPVTIDYNYAAQNMFVNLGKHPVMFEFLADYWAYYTLKEMGAPEGTMLSTLLALRDDVRSHPADAASLEVGQLLDTRAKCMALLENFSPDASLHTIKLDVNVLATEGAIKSIATHTVLTSKAGLTIEETLETINELTAEVLKLGRPATVDEAFWSCATVAVLLPSSTRTRTMLATARPQDMPAAFMKFAGSEYDGVDPLPVYIEIFDGIPLLEAGKLYRRPKAAPDLYVRKAAYRGFQDGWHQVDVTLVNGGHLPTGTPFAIRGMRGGKPARLTLCTAEQRATRGEDCSTATLKESIPKRDSRTLTLYVQAPPDPPTSDRLLSFDVDSCDDVPQAKPNDAAPVCNIPEEWESNNRGYVNIGMKPNLVVTAVETVDQRVTITIANAGYAATKAPFELRTYFVLTPYEASLCDVEVALVDSTCKGVWISEPLAPGQTRTVTFNLVRTPKGTPIEGTMIRPYLNDLRYYIDACAGWTEYQSMPTCAIEEVDETDNLFAPPGKRK